jgi:glycosyltransferase involved in cell wall biosynthesis
MNDFRPIVNTRTLSANVTGVQRYVNEILVRLTGKYDAISPSQIKSGIGGHMWEQLLLPRKINPRLIWSPANTGPVNYRNQVVSIMDLSFLDNPAWSSLVFSSWYSFIIPRLLNNVRHVITISEFSKSRLINYFPNIENKITVTKLGVSQTFIAVCDEQLSFVRNKLRIPSSRYILSLSSIEPRKNLSTLLLVWEKFQKKIPDDVWLVIAGGIGKKSVFGESSIKKIPPRVFFTGRIDDNDLPAIYSGALFFVYIPFYEGFGLPPLEAMSCGTPVMAANNSALPEVLGSSGILVDCLDIEEIGTNMLNLIEDNELRLKLKKKGLLKAKTFNWNDTAIKTMNILRKVNQE